MDPDCEIFLFGSEKGTAEIADKLCLQNIEQIPTNEFGTPLINHMFEQCQKLGSCEIMCYINSDIILMSDFLEYVKKILELLDKFVIVGQRWDLSVDKQIDFSVDWEKDIKKSLDAKGVLHSKTGIDFFVFRRGTVSNIPPFAIGRPAWDQWLLYKFHKDGIPAIDATKMITAIHQNHDYHHISYGDGKSWNGIEAQRNRYLAHHNSLAALTIDDVDYFGYPEGLKQNYAILTRFKRCFLKISNLVDPVPLG